MRIAQNQTIERILESENYNLKGVVIGDKGHSLDIYNRNDSICYRSLGNSLFSLHMESPQIDFKEKRL